MQIVEHSAVQEAGAVLARKDGETIIVIDPALAPAQREQLIKELLET